MTAVCPRWFEILTTLTFGALRRKTLCPQHVRPSHKKTREKQEQRNRVVHEHDGSTKNDICNRRVFTELKNKKLCLSCNHFRQDGDKLNSRHANLRRHGTCTNTTSQPQMELFSTAKTSKSNGLASAEMHKPAATTPVVTQPLPGGKKKTKRRGIPGKPDLGLAARPRISDLAAVSSTKKHRVSHPTRLAKSFCLGRSRTDKGSHSRLTFLNAAQQMRS